MISKLFFSILTLSLSVQAQWQHVAVFNKEKDAVSASSIAIDDSSIWIGTGSDGIQLWCNGRIIVRLTKADGLVSNSVRDLAVDREHRVWIATDEGLSMYDGAKFKNFQRNDITLLTNDITSVHVDNDQMIWAGTSRGLVRIHGDRWSLFDIKSTNQTLLSDKIQSIASDWRGILWVGTERGLASFDGKSWAVYTRRANGLPEDNIRDVAVSEKGIVWVATDNGAGRLEGKKCSVYLDGWAVNRVAVDLIGRCWAATPDDGLIRMKLGVEKTYKSGDGILANDVKDVQVDRFGNIWVAHKQGLQELTDPDDADAQAAALLEWGDVFRVKGNLGEARRFYSKFTQQDVLSKTPSWPTLMLRMARLDWVEGDVPAASDWTRKFLAAYPTRPEFKSVLLDFADSLAMHRKWTDAQRTYQQYLDTYPDDPINKEILRKQANLLELDGDTFGASRLLQKVNNKYPDHSRFDEYRFHIAELEERQKGRSSVQVVYDDLVQNSRDPEVLFRLSDLYDEVNRTAILDRIRGTVAWKSFPTPSAVNCIEPVDGNTFWLGLERDGVMRWDSKAQSGTTYLTGLSGVNIRQVYQDIDGDIWAVVDDISRKVLCNLNYSRKKTHWTIMGPPFMDKKIYQVYYRPKGQVIVAGTSKGLMIGGRIFDSRKGLPSNEVKFVHEDASGYIWLISGTSLVQVASEPKVIIKPIEMNFREVRDFIVDRRETKWLATDAGLAAYDGTWRSWTTGNGLSTNDLTCVAVSDEGHIAAGSAKGLDYFNGRFWLHFDKENGLPVTNVRDVVFAADGSLWIASDQGLHQRLSTGDAEKALMVNAALEEEEKAWQARKYDGVAELFSPLSSFGDLQEWTEFKNAVNLERQGRLNDALALYSKIRRENPVTIWVSDIYLYRVARKMETAGPLNQAAAIYKELGEKWSVEQKSTFRIEESLIRMTDLFTAEGDLQKAADLLSWTTRQFPTGSFRKDAVDRYLVILNRAFQKGTLSREPLLKEFLEIFPEDPHADLIRLRLAETYVVAAQSEKAAKVYSLLSGSSLPGIKPVAERQLNRINRLTK
ncbi:MAG: tetratricopeptide repeat protein [Bacteroidetes bacterium]|nr:tetratricopeptide repeat protein [Bacteroidota bacterium]